MIEIRLADDTASCTQYSIDIKMRAILQDGSKGSLNILHHCDRAFVEDNDYFDVALAICYLFTKHYRACINELKMVEVLLLDEAINEVLKIQAKTVYSTH